MARAAIVLSAMAIACTPTCPEDVPAFSNDPESVRQWYMPAIGVPEAWSVQRGDEEVVVAMIDNGFDLGHPDLVGQLWTNAAEQVDGVDDDGNGYVDDVHGWDFLDGDPDAELETDGEIEPDLASHGTSAAGVVAARTDNGVGVAACCPGCRLMLLRARDFRDAHDVMPRLAEAVLYATENGARVISVSDGVLDGAVDPSIEADVEEALAMARDSGVVVVVSAGNDSAGGVRWPGRLETVVGVGSVGPGFEPSPWTSYGPEVDVAAPGECVTTTRAGGGYGTFEGTSASAPVVAGLAALLVAEHPTWSVEEVVERIRSSASDARFDSRPEVEGMLGAGVVDFAAALSPP